jgi:hypothetical protein
MYILAQCSYCITGDVLTVAELKGVTVVTNRDDARVMQCVARKPVGRGRGILTLIASCHIVARGARGCPRARQVHFPNSDGRLTVRIYLSSTYFCHLGRSLVRKPVEKAYCKYAVFQRNEIFQA